METEPPGTPPSLDEVLSDLEERGHLDPGACDRATFECAIEARIDDLGLDGIDAYLAVLDDDPDERDALHAAVADARARLADDDLVPAEAVEDLVEQLEATAGELEAANQDREVVTESLEAMDSDLRDAARELDAVNVQLEARIDDVERMAAVIDALVETHPSPAAVVDATLVVRAWSTSLAALSGVAADTAVNRPLTDTAALFPRDSVAVALRSLANDAPTRSSAETLVERTDGRRHRVRGQALTSTDGETVGILVTIADDRDDD